MEKNAPTLDYFLTHPPTQPKREVGDYVESMGVNVPRRFETLEEALGVVNDGGSILLRSEHPVDYVGASGFASSVRIDRRAIEEGYQNQVEYELAVIDEAVIRSSSERGAISPKQLGGPGHYTVEHMIVGNVLTTDTDKTLRQLLLLQELTTPMERYARLAGHVVRPFLEQSSFSFWELVGGTNVTIVADDVVDGQYHAFAYDGSEKPTRYDGAVLSGDGRTVQGSSAMFNPEFSGTIIAAYEQVRNLPRFASSHCPIVELQVDQSGTPWFLQYHRSRDFTPYTDQLAPNDYPEQEGWLKAEMVRGAVGALATVKTALWYPRRYDRHALPEAEDASTDFHYDAALSDLLSPRRKAFFENSEWEHMYKSLAAYHAQRVRWFKPQTALTLGRRGVTDELLGDNIKSKVSHLVMREEKMARVVVDVATDGRIGYVRLHPGVEQPQVTDY